MALLSREQRNDVRRVVEGVIADRWQGMTLEQRRAAFLADRHDERVLGSLVIYTEGLGVLGCGTSEAGWPVVQEKERLHMRLLFGDVTEAQQHAA